MSDTVALMFSVAAAGTTVLWYRHFYRTPPRWFHTGVGFSLATGGMLGLACGAKMNSLVIVILAGVMVAMIMVQRWRKHSRSAAMQAGLHGLIILIIAITVFTLINPAILNDFPGGLAATIMEHRHTESVQVDLYYPHPLGLWGKLNAVIFMAFFGWPLFLTMLAIVVWTAVRHWQDVSVRFAVSWWVIAFVCVTQWLPFAWPRYTLPLLAPSALLVGYVAARAIHRTTGMALIQGKFRHASQ
jgi:hypothetical protein